ncbi:MAG TPA: hypothetical protein VHK05_04985 [Candidatus Limnocylindrales bacterium]|jgi:hypothetical protein|nr:hypothetical protein [Candidatus Limnocylindrales bacterium]
MTMFDETDRRIATWFTDETVRVPERTIDAVLAHARAHPRRRDPLATLRRDPMARPFTAGLFAPVPLLAAIGLIVVAVLGGAVVGGVLDLSGPAPLPVPSASPIATPSPSPSPRIIHVDLVEVAGQDASIDITDRSGALVDAETGQPADGGSVGGRGIELANDPVDPMVIVVTWTGTPCDTTHALEIDADGRTMTLARPRCEGDAIPRDLQLRLRFREAIDSSAIAATLVTE